MSLYPAGGVKRAILLMIQANRGVMGRREMLEGARLLGGKNPNGGNCALKPLIDDGMLVLEYRLTPKGIKLLGEGKAP